MVDPQIEKTITLTLDVKKKGRETAFSQLFVVQNQNKHLAFMERSRNRETFDLHLSPSDF